MYFYVQIYFVSFLKEFNDTFNNISVISWRLVLLVEETGGLGENQRPVANQFDPVTFLCLDIQHQISLFSFIFRELILYNFCLWNRLLSGFINLIQITIYSKVNNCRSYDRMVVGFITTCTISAYHHQSCEFESRSGEVYSIQHYVIKFVHDLRQVCGFLLVLMFPPPIKLTATI